MPKFCKKKMHISFHDNPGEILSGEFELTTPPPFRQIFEKIRGRVN